MRVVLASVGTRGDVQPMVALAKALARRGHSSVLACPATFASFVRAQGVEHAELGEDLSALVASGGSDVARSISGMKRYFTDQMTNQAPRLLELAEGADAICGTGMAWTVPSIGERLGIPATVIAFSTAALPSRLHPPPLAPRHGLPRWVNGLLWWLSDRMQNGLMGGALTPARTALGLPPIGAFTEHLLVDASVIIAADDAVLAPDPAWGDRYPYAGFLFLEDRAPLDPALDAWLAEGDPPVHVGFGSMAGAQTDRIAAILEGALRGRRCLIGSGAAGLFGGRALPDGFFVVKEAPHEVLFPRVACVVHHGGSGTTAAALRAGVPQVILPMMLDQFHHAHRLAEAGLAPRAPTMEKVSAKTLARAIEGALALPAEPRARIAERLRASDAGARIVERLERRVGTRAATSVEAPPG